MDDVTFVCNQQTDGLKCETKYAMGISGNVFYASFVLFFAVLLLNVNENTLIIHHSYEPLGIRARLLHLIYLLQ